MAHEYGEECLISQEDAVRYMLAHPEHTPKNGVFIASDHIEAAARVIGVSGVSRPAGTGDIRTPYASVPYLPISAPHHDLQPNKITP